MKSSCCLCVELMWTTKLTQLSVARPRFPHFSSRDINRKINPPMVRQCCLAGSSVRSGPCFQALTLWLNCPSYLFSALATFISLCCSALKRIYLCVRFVPFLSEKDLTVRPRGSWHFSRAYVCVTVRFQSLSDNLEQNDNNIFPSVVLCSEEPHRAMKKRITQSNNFNRYPQW